MNNTDKTVANSLSRELSTTERLPAEYSWGTPLNPRPNGVGADPPRFG
jgi:hypothetical protein